MFNLISKLDTRILLIFIFIVAISFRLIHFQGTATFAYDQARDAFESLDLIKGDHIKVFGPQTDLVGLHHGTLYWYLISPFYFFTGNPSIVRLWLIILNCASIFFVYKLADLLFKSRNIALISSLLFAVSFEATQYARWLSNPSPAILTSIISYWALKKLIDGSHWALPILLISWSLSIQLELFLIYQMIAFMLIWISIKGFKLPALSFKTYLISFIGLILTSTLMIAQEFSFQFKEPRILLTFLGQGFTINDSFTDKLFSFLDRLVNSFYLNVWGINLFIAGVVTIFILSFCVRHILAKRYSDSLKFLLIWIISPVILYFFHPTQGGFLMLSTSIGVMILTAFFLNSVFSQKSKLVIVGVLGLIIFGNFSLINTYNKRGEVLFTAQDKLTLGDELATIDWIYQKSEGQPFHLNTVTNPAFINTTWAYLFDNYARRKYKTMPIWWGETQVGVFGANVVFSPEQETELHFLIIEPSAGQTTGIVDAVRFLEDSRSQVLETKKFDTITVEKRKITRPRIFTNEDVFYYIQHKNDKN